MLLRLFVPGLLVAALGLFILPCALRGDGVSAHGDTTVLECDPGADSGDGVDLGIIFTVDQPFVSIEMLFEARSGSDGVYEFTAELIRSDTFVGPLESTTRFSADLPPRNPGEPGYARVHMDFGYVPVTGTESFALRFVDASPPNLHPLYGIANGDHCPEVHMKNEQTGDDLTDRGNTPYMLVLATGVPLNIWGDTDCTDSVSAVDALEIFTSTLAEPAGAPGACIHLNRVVMANGVVRTWGDVDCSGGPADLDDAMIVLRFLARVPTAPVTDCPSVPQAVQVAS
jgi:hypothetical protein